MRDEVKKRYSVAGIVAKEDIDTFRMMLPASFEEKPRKGNFLLGAYSDDMEPSGVCWYEFNGFFYEILFIGVLPSCRRQGVGTLLVNSLFESLYRMNMALPVRIEYIRDEETEIFDKFVHSLGKFIFLEPNTLYKVTKADRNKSAVYRRLLNTRSDAELFFKQSESLRRSFIGEQHSKGLLHLDALSGREDIYDKELSFCTVKDGRICAVLLIKRDENNARELSYLYVDEAYRASLESVLAAAAQAIENNCSETELDIQTVNHRSNKLLKGIFADSKPVSYEIECATWDFSL